MAKASDIVKDAVTELAKADQALSGQGDQEEEQPDEAETSDTEGD